MSQFIVSVRIPVEAKDAGDAQRRVQAQLPKAWHALVSDIEYNSLKKPVLSPEIIKFFEGEIENNEADPEGTTLSNAECSLIQMPQDILAQACHVKKTLKLKKNIERELDALIAKYGCATTLETLLPDD